MFSVVSSESAPHHLKQLREWLVIEWAQIDRSEGTKDGLLVPSPLLAIDGQQLIGGLTFTRHSVPGRKELGLWINALLVAPEHRGVGVGSQLVQAAEVEAAGTEATELFVYTDVPELYRKLGWVTVDSSGEQIVLKRAVTNTS